MTGPMPSGIPIIAKRESNLTRSMQLLDLTLPTIAENLALDEALLEQAEAGSESIGLLRLWEPPQYAVVIGRSSAVECEVDSSYCRGNDVEIARRCSGGASVVIGPGCLTYSVILGFARFPGLEMIENAHRFVLSTMLSGLEPLAAGVSCAGTSDLAWMGRKFSGNSLRIKRTHLLYHGTLLYEFPLQLISHCLRTAPRQPAYRDGRTHADFVCNLPVNQAQLRAAISRAWNVDSTGHDWPHVETARLVADRYGQPEWVFSR